jgi:hypothetical protein
MLRSKHLLCRNPAGFLDFEEEEGSQVLRPAQYCHSLIPSSLVKGTQGPFVTVPDANSADFSTG